MTARTWGMLAFSGIGLVMTSYLGVIVLNQTKHPDISGAVATDVGESVTIVDPVDAPPPDRTFYSHIPSSVEEPAQEELLWLARCIYSETKRPIEQLLVGWIVRNRVETQYGGNDSYKDVILDPYQFSAFNPESELEMPEIGSDTTGWDETLRVARYIMTAPPSDRPFSVITRHFYSERSMRERKKPSWVGKTKALQINGHDIDEERFRFYSGIM